MTVTVEAFSPTEEQLRCFETAKRGGDMVIDAYAGCGKTTTLSMLSKELGKKGVYFCFNKQIADESQGKFPANVSCSTAHSLAYRSVGKEYAHRLHGNRMPSYVLAKKLGLPRDVSVQIEKIGGKPKPKDIRPGAAGWFVKGMVEKFCKTDDKEITAKHWRLDETLGDVSNHVYLANKFLDGARKYWEDIQLHDGKLPFTHDFYLKMWELEKPTLPGEFVMIDEAQDLNPCMLSILLNQDCQRIMVGDRNQSIYAWNLAINAMEKVDWDRCVLTNSFRFGKQIAEVANEHLRLIDPAAPPLIGAGPNGEVVDRQDNPTARLSCTNADVIEGVFSAIEFDKKFHVVGGTAELCKLVEGLYDLKETGESRHPDVCAYESFDDLADDWKKDFRGMFVVRLVKKHTRRELISALNSSVPSQKADIVLSTIHKAKGCEWDSVHVSELHRSDDCVNYVAVTRAKKMLSFVKPNDDEDGDEDNQRRVF